MSRFNSYDEYGDSQSVKTSGKESYFEISIELCHYSAKFRCQITPTARKMLHAGLVSGIC